MKTIKEASKEWDEKYSEQLSDGYTPASEKLKANNRSSFIAGVEFAQQWINIEDELPNRLLIGEKFLIKYHDGEVISATRIEIGVQKDKHKEGDYTHWRPIELK